MAGLNGEQQAEGGKVVGCGALLWIPLATVVIAVRLLFLRSVPPQARLGPYRTIAARDGEARPLTRGVARLIGGMLLFWTLLLPGAFATRAIMVYDVTNPVFLVMCSGVTWVLMLIGHLISVKLFGVIEPRLPRA